MKLSYKTIAILFVLGIPAPAATASEAPPALKGQLTWEEASVEILEVHRDDYGVGDKPSDVLAQLPPFNFQFTTIGSDLLPLQGGTLNGDHPRWNFLVETGRISTTANGQQTLEFPLSLQERNANCTHNGILTLLRSGSSNQFQGEYRIDSETCQYLKFDLRAKIGMRYLPQPQVDSTAAETRYRGNTRQRLETRNFSDLAEKYASVNIGAFSGSNKVSGEDITTSGLIIGDVHYSSGCPTRRGAHPFCERLSLPSYSLAKSLLAGLGLMRMEKLYPGSSNVKISTLIPECESWGDTTLLQTLNMKTGRFDSAATNVDEYSALNTEKFFTAKSHAQKLEFGCGAWQQRKPPGQRFVYHTSDTYVLGTAMNTLLRSHTTASADFFEDLIQPLWRPLNLSDASKVSLRTEDETAQPLTGYGLTMQPDDFARLAVALNRGEFADKLDDRMFGEAMQLSNSTAGQKFATDAKLYYRHGFWALDAAPLLGCNKPLLIPFMSGYGGINLVMMPNDTVYYLFSDNGQFHITSAIVESHKIRPMCDSHAVKMAADQDLSKAGRQ